MERREKVFFILASLFISALVMANIIGITKFFEFRVPLWGYTVQVPVGIIPYPVTFLATDLISELYGRRRANWVVFVGFLMNVFLIAVCWVAQAAPFSGDWLGQIETGAAAGRAEPWHRDVYPYIWNLIGMGVFASMVAYLVAQLVDVQLYHFWRGMTRGKHLWLRNNASTMCSQLIDSTVIICLIFGSAAMAGELEAESPFGGRASGLAALGVFIFNAYIFKFFFAAFDTPFMYLFTSLLRPYVGDPDPGERRYGPTAAAELE